MTAERPNIKDVAVELSLFATHLVVVVLTGVAALGAVGFSIAAVATAIPALWLSLDEAERYFDHVLAFTGTAIVCWSVYIGGVGIDKLFGISERLGRVVGPASEQSRPASVR